jgi:hypothetical protein
MHATPHPTTAHRLTHMRIIMQFSFGPCQQHG